MILTALLDEFLEERERVRPGLRGLLKPGLSPADIKIEVASTGFSPPPELSEYYSWRGDSEPERLGQGSWFDLFFMPALQRGVVHHFAIKKLFPRIPGIFPILTNVAGDDYVIDLARPNGDLSPVYAFVGIEAYGYPWNPEYPSIAAMVSDFIDRIRSGAIYYDEQMNLVSSHPQAKPYRSDTEEENPDYLQDH